METLWSTWTRWVLMVTFDLWRYPDAAPRDRDSDHA